MPGTRRDRGLIALIIGFAMLALAVLGTLLLFQRHQQAQRWVLHSLAVRDQIGLVMSHLQDAETGQRGYLITRDPAYLDPYRSARGQLDASLDRLRDLTGDNARQTVAAQSLAQCARQRVARLEVVIELERRGDLLSMSREVRFGTGKAIMDRCRAIVAAMKAEEGRLLDARLASARWQSTRLTAWLLLSAAALMLLAIYATRDARQRAKAAWDARDELELAHRQLVEEAASREAAEAQVRQMHKMESIGQLTGGVAHDFNNMLAIVIGSLDMAKRRLDRDPAKAGEAIDNALHGAERAAELTQRLLAFSRQQPLAPRPLDCNRLVSGMSELLRRTIGETVHFETVLAGGLWPAFIDGSQLENAVVNLCVNARDAMPDGGKLTIETANTHLDDAYAAGHAEVTAGQYVMVSVSDTGTGMPPEVIERAFDPFYTTKGVGKGTGLGLSQVYGFVKQSGGHVKIYSEPGVGTSVKLYLPRHLGATEAVAAAERAGAEMPRARAGETVLVVEDEERVRRLSVEALRELGYAVLEAGSAEEALRVLEAQPSVSLLFTDVVMPGANGRRLAEQAMALRPGLKVLYTTGYTRNAIVHNGMLDHDVAFLAKPFTLQQLATKVREVLDG